MNRERRRTVAAINAATAAAILDRYPDHAQRNLAAAGIRLVARGEEAGPAYRAIETAWAWIDRVRMASNQATAEAEAATDPEGLHRVQTAYAATLEDLCVATTP